MTEHLRLSAVFLTLPALLLSSAALAGEISTAPFHSVEINGGGHADVTYGPQTKVDMQAGSADITRFEVKDGTLRIYACEHRCPAHYDLKLAITVPELNNVAVKGGGAIIGHGRFPGQKTINAAVQGGGVIDVRDITVSSANAAVQGGGVIRTAAEQHLSAAVMGGGEITYRGHPQITRSVMGGGVIKAE